MKLIVTGGRGYIGSRLVSRLLELGHEVVILDDLSTSINHKKSDSEFIKADITDLESLLKIKVAGADAVLHLAAQSSGPKSIEIPDKDISINILGTLNILKWCLQNDISRIIYASSFVVYGDHSNEKPIDECSSCEPKSIYALSKRYSERLLDIYAEHHQISWNVIRQFNVYGPGQDLTRSDQGMVSIFMNLIMNNSKIKVQGSLDRYRDFIHINDVIQGWELCLKNNKPNQIFNLGSGKKTTIRDLIENIRICFDKEIEVFEEGNTPGDILGCHADIEKIKKLLGFKPKFNIKDGVEDMSNWVKAFS